MINSEGDVKAMANILIVEDEKAINTLIKKILNLWGISAFLSIRINIANAQFARIL